MTCCCCEEMTTGHCAGCGVSLCQNCGVHGLCGVCMRMKEHRRELQLAGRMQPAPPALILSASSDKTTIKLEAVKPERKRKNK